MGQDTDTHPHIFNPAYQRQASMRQILRTSERQLYINFVISIRQELLRGKNPIK